MTTNMEKTDVKINFKAPIYYIENLKASEVKEISAEKLAALPPPVKPATKEEYKKWCADSLTSTFALTGFIGLNPKERVNQNNPADTMYGLICDYDTYEFKPEEVLGIVHKAKIKPNFVMETYSGGWRVVWLFTKPIKMMGDPEMDAHIIEMVAKHFKATKLLPMLDGAYLSTTQVYQIGFKTHVISADLVDSTKVEAQIRQSWSTWEYKGTKVDLKKVWDEMVRRGWDKNWSKGQQGFVLNSMGERFWVEGSNSSGTIIRETGVQCFVDGSRGFYRWEDIFGPTFAKEEKESRELAFINQYHYDGRRYIKWGYDEQHRKVLITESDRQIEGSAMAAGFSKLELPSVLAKIRTPDRTVIAMAPFLYNENETVNTPMGKCLNSARVKCMKPSDIKITVWGDQFPHIAKFLDNFFRPTTFDQKNHFLQWLKWGYEGALAGYLPQGQAIYVGGEGGAGKNLLTEGIISPIFGGHADGTPLMSGSIQNKEAITMPVISFPDLCNNRAQMGKILKQLVVNEYKSYRAFYADNITVQTNLRCVFSFNLTAASLDQIFWDASFADKVNIYSVQKQAFPNRPSQLFAKELPFFLSWLKNEFVFNPKDFKDDRLGIVAQQCPQILSRLVRQETDGVEEILLRWRRWFFENRAESIGVTGDFVNLAPSELLSELIGVASPVSSVIPLIYRNSYTKLGQAMSKVAENNDWIERAARTYKIWSPQARPSSYDEEKAAEQPVSQRAAMQMEDDERADYHLKKVY